MRLQIISLAALVAIGSTFQAARANLILDGSFETPVVGAGSYVDYTPGPMGPWTVVGNDVLLINTTYTEPSNGILAFNAEDGNQSLDLTGAGNTSPNDGVEQTITTTPGTQYVVSFWVGAALSNKGSGYYSDPATDLLIDGGPATSFKVTPTVSGYVTWEHFTSTFTAAGASTTIEFQNGTSTPTALAGLDNVSVDAVPLPVAAYGGMALIAGLVVTRKLPRLSRSI
ncbi:MAG TPA: carbohydrate binding domain-containing protein [Tepidisphaeraceae bacterium]|jgi:hypothetical protein